MTNSREAAILYPSPSPLPESSRSRVVEALNARLADGIDLQTQVKHAHWNVKGPHFAPLHALFDGLAAALAGFNDEIAERAVTLGGVAAGTARLAVRVSRIAEIPPAEVRGLPLVRHVAERLEAHLAGLREARRDSADAGDEDTVDLLTGMVEELEKQGWFLRATLEG